MARLNKRPPGSGSIYPRGQRWVAALTWNGKRRQISVASRTEAQRALMELKAIRDLEQWSADQ